MKKSLTLPSLMDKRALYAIKILSEIGKNGVSDYFLNQMVKANSSVPFPNFNCYFLNGHKRAAQQHST